MEKLRRSQYTLSGYIRLIKAKTNEEEREISDRMWKDPKYDAEVRAEYEKWQIEEFMDGEVRVFCPSCKNGVNAIWYGSLTDWSLELAKHIDNKPPAWYLYAVNHQRAHDGHKIMVKYPDKIVPLDLRGNLKCHAELPAGKRFYKCPKSGITYHCAYCHRYHCPVCCPCENCKNPTTVRCFAYNTWEKQTRAKRIKIC